MKHMSGNGIALLKSFEGCSLTAYYDIKGYSIGYGHFGVNKGDTITKDEANWLLVSDLKMKYEPCVNAYDKHYNFNQNEFDALVDFAYNCGTGNLAKLLKNGTATRDEIRKKIILYDKAGGKKLAGLTRRRKSELDLFNTTDTSTVWYYPKYTGTSRNLNEMLKEVSAPYGTVADRRELAEVNGIENYTGTYAQNIILINRVKNGVLKRV